MWDVFSLIYKWWSAGPAVVAPDVVTLPWSDDSDRTLVWSDNEPDELTWS